MNILFVGNTIGSIYKFRFELVKRLIAEGHQLSLLAQNENEDELLEHFLAIGCNYQPIKITRRGTNPIKDLQLLFNYYRSFKALKPDVILTYTIKPSIYASLASQTRKVKLINTVTGLGTGFQDQGLVNKIIRMLYKLAFRKSTQVIFQNQENLDLFLKLKLIDPPRTTLVPGSGVNLEKFQPQARTEKKAYPIILFIARVMKEKGIEEYLEAAKQIIAKGYQVEFQILGYWEESIWQKKVERYQELGYVKYLGTSNDVRVQIRNVDIVLNPSYHEGMSNVLLEAGAMGKLLMGSSISGIKEIIEPVNPSLLFKKEDREDLVRKLEFLLNMPATETVALAVKQKEFIEKEFSRETIVNKYLEVITA